MRTGIAKVAAGLALTLGLALGGVASVAAQDDTASLTVHQRLCGDQYEGGSPFDECHDVLVGDSYEFTVVGSVTDSAFTDAATGNGTFDPLPAGSYEFFGGVPAEFVEKEIYCTDTVTGDTLEVMRLQGGVRIDLTAGAEVVCDVYEHPIDLSGQPPDDGDDDDNGSDDDDDDVTQLPNTGAGATTAATGLAGLLLAAMAAGASGLALRRRPILS